MARQYWTVKEAAEALGLSEKTIRRRIKDGTLKAEQTQGKFGVEYQITDLEDIQPAGKELEKAIDIEGENALVKALDIIRTLQEDNKRLAGQVGYLQAQLQELNNRVNLLAAPKQKQSLWNRLLWWRSTPEA